MARTLQSGYQALDQSLLSQMFNEIERVVDGNWNQVKAVFSKVSTEISKQVQKDFTLPVSNNVQLVRDIVQENFKSVNFTLSGISSNCSSTTLNVIKMGENVDKFLADIKQMNDNLTTYHSGQDQVRSALGDISQALVRVRQDPNNEELAKLNGAVSDLTQPVGELSQEVKLLKSDHSAKQNWAVREMSAEEYAPFNQMTEESLSPAPDARIAIKEGILIKLEEYSKANRSDFVQLNNKIDRMMGEYRAEGGHLREELSTLTLRLTEWNQTPMGCSTGENNDSHRKSGSSERVDTASELKNRLHKAIANSDWPKFTGEGEYNHLRFIQWIDTAKLSCDNPTWVFWRGEICKKFSHSAWWRKKQSVLDADKFVPGESDPAQWVTKQFGRLKCFDATADKETINFKLMSLMDGKVEYAVKIAMSRPDADLSEFINILEEICNKARIGKRRFTTRNLQNKASLLVNSKAINTDKEKDKGKASTSAIKCYTCGELGHTLRRCNKNVNTIKEAGAPGDDSWHFQGSAINHVFSETLQKLFRMLT
ncbi:uncharacterized protein VP01_4798g1 [Puccinia sorghi]|uniref:CCHC-type domain-containing protein n=1 Tax=Puccinia sorghi TaxID=27349 RepID=A0A0L6UMN6_9BASI|nr:uncharacterized protein VP01_4798g1 [Puccinia sorghi]